MDISLENKRVLKNIIYVTRDTTKLGNKTIQTLNQQTEKFYHMEDILDEINNSLSRSERIMRRMKSISGLIIDIFYRISLPQDRKHVNEITPKKVISDNDYEDLLDEISDTLVSIKEQSIMINQQLTTQSVIIDQVVEKVEFTKERLDTGLKIMKNIT